MVSKYNKYLWTVVVVLIFAATWYGISEGGVDDPTRKHFGFFSLVPALVTLLICFITRNVILALFVGVALGGLITTQYNIINAYLIPSLGSESYAKILLVYLWALGGLIGMWNKNGGALYFANYVAQNFIKSRRSAKLFTWIMGVIFHQGGTISTVLTGTTVKPVADEEKVSHEELSYIVDSTASPIAALIPFNAWPAYIGGLVLLPEIAAIIPDTETAIGYIFKAIPYNFYSIFAITFTLLFSLDLMPFVGKKMRKAINRAQEEGKLDADDAQPMLAKELNTTNVPDYYKPGMIDFILPISVLLGFSIISWPLAGSPMIFEAFGLSVITGMVTSRIRGMQLNDVFDAVLDGIKGVTLGAIILGFAVTLGMVSRSLGTSHYIIDVTAGVLENVPFILPAILMILCMFISFSIGSSFGTYAVMYPLALPLAFALSPDPFYFTLNFAAILGGAIFGDQCSPISDTTILSAMACGADLMDHVLTQLPMALGAAGISAALYTILSYVALM